MSEKEIKREDRPLDRPNIQQTTKLYEESEIPTIKDILKKVKSYFV